MNYTYDDLYRLTEENVTDPVLGNETISYTYDSFGNRLKKTDSSGSVSYSYDDNDRLISEGSVTHTYDDNGNMLTKSDGTDTVFYSYDFENRLTFVQGPDGTAEYVYDADGIRVRSVTDGVITNYLVDKNRAYAQVLEERDDSGSLTVSYVYGDDLIRQKRGGSVSYYHYDGLGSTRVLTDDAGGVTDTYTYEAFGDLIDHIGETENNYLFTGEQYDPNAGFYYLRARYYSSGNGRFVSQDSWQGSIYNPLTLHRYIYADANPVIFIDPLGKFSVLSQLNVTRIINTLSKIVNISLKIAKRVEIRAAVGPSRYIIIPHAFMIAKKGKATYRYDLATTDPKSAAWKWLTNVGGMVRKEKITKAELFFKPVVTFPVAKLHPLVFPLWEASVRKTTGYVLLSDPNCITWTINASLLAKMMEKMR